MCQAHTGFLLVLYLTINLNRMVRRYILGKKMMCLTFILVLFSPLETDVTFPNFFL
jgi:hypothetical protein